MAVGFNDVLEALSDDLTAFLAPYQPNLVGYPNLAPTAGQIVATLVAPGEPIQKPFTDRMEQGYGQVSVVQGKVTKPMPYIRTDIPTLTVTSPVAGSFYEKLRYLRQIIVRVWAPTNEKRRAIADLVEQHLGNAFFLNQPTDGTITELEWTGSVDDDADQAHSIYVRQIMLMADVTATVFYPSATVTTPEAPVVVHPISDTLTQPTATASLL